MSDFLHNLMSRTLGQAPVVRPRPLARFEPARPVGVSALGLESEPANFEELPDEVSAAPRARPPARAAMPPADSAPAQPLHIHRPSAALAPQSDPVTPADTAWLARPSQPPLAAPARLQPAPARPGPADPQAAPAERAPVQPRPATQISPSSRRPNAAAEPSISPQLQAVPRLAPAQPPVAEQAVTRIVERVAEHEPRPAKPSSPAAVLATPQIVPYLEPAPAQAAPEATPTITVTIGRIEVRAHVQGAPAPRSQPRVMSLDEYLRQRSGGGAR